MINRELVSATVKTYGGVDSYGQQLSTLQSQRTIQITFGILSHNKTDDIRYQNISHYALTQDKSVTDKDIIVVDGANYKVEFVYPHKRMNELFLCAQK